MTTHTVWSVAPPGEYQWKLMHWQAFVTLTLTRWPSFTNLTRIPYWVCKYELATSRFSKVIIWYTEYWLTGPKLYTMPLHGWSQIQQFLNCACKITLLRVVSVDVKLQKIHCITAVIYYWLLWNEISVQPTAVS